MGSTARNADAGSGPKEPPGPLKVHKIGPPRLLFAGALLLFAIFAGVGLQSGNAGPMDLKGMMHTEAGQDLKALKEDVRGLKRQARSAVDSILRKLNDLESMAKAGR